MKFATMVSINDELCEVIGNWQSYDSAKNHIDEMIRWLEANREYVEYEENRVFCAEEFRYHTTEIDVYTKMNERIFYQIMEIKNEVEPSFFFLFAADIIKII